MTEDVPLAPGVPECNGSVAPEKGPPQADGIADGIAGAVGTVPCMDVSTDALLMKGNVEESRNALGEDTARGDIDGEEHCGERREENDAARQQGTAEPQDAGTGSEELQEGQRVLGAAETPSGSAEQRGIDAEDEEEEEEEGEDTEEDEVQVVELQPGSGEASRQQQEGGTEPFPPSSPGCNTAERGEEQHPGSGKKNDISRHSYSRYNTISYRKIRKGNTKQRIDEFESMMHL
ncbi:ERMIN protein, partial [Penelope pileata]|nr:ERMIN protein [Penelope pileata]